MEEKYVKIVSASLGFPYDDMGDEFAGSCLLGPEGEDIVFDVLKGAGVVSVSISVDYGKMDAYMSLRILKKCLTMLQVR